MERIKKDVKRLLVRAEKEDKEHILNLFMGYMFMVEYIKGDVKWRKKIQKLLKSI